MADLLAKEGYVVYAVDLYNGEVAANSSRAGQLAGSVRSNPEQAVEKMKKAADYLRTNENSHKLASLGWCFGGGQSLLAALHAAKQASACVMYYGMPTEDVEKLKTLNCDVLNIWPTQDQWINKEMMDKFEKNMQAAGKKVTIKPYDAAHAFANPSNVMGTYNEAAAKDAYQNTISYFKERLK